MKIGRQKRITESHENINKKRIKMQKNIYGRELSREVKDQIKCPGRQSKSVKVKSWMKNGKRK